MRRMIPQKFQNWIKKIFDKIVHNEDTNTTEFGGNVEVDGNLQVNQSITDIEGNEAIDIGTEDLSIHKNVNIGSVDEPEDLFVSGTYYDKNNEAITPTKLYLYRISGELMDGGGVVFDYAQHEYSFSYNSAPYVIDLYSYDYIPHESDFYDIFEDYFKGVDNNDKAILHLIERTGFSLRDEDNNYIDILAFDISYDYYSNEILCSICFKEVNSELPTSFTLRIDIRDFISDFVFKIVCLNNNNIIAEA